MSAYDYEPKDSSPYLRLKSKGEKIKIRLVSDPIHFEEPDVKGKLSDRFAWKVLDRADGEVKAFKGGVMIYKAIKELAMDEEWGDPTGYDFTITRTEEQGNYYSVTASPNKKPITADEKKLVEEADLDLTRLFSVEEKETFESREESQNAEADKEIDIEEIQV